MKPAIQEVRERSASTRLSGRLALIFGLLAIPRTVNADGLLVQLRSIQSGCEVSVLTSDQILARAQSEFKVLVQRSETGQLIPDVVVSMAFRPDVVYGSRTTPAFCNPVSPAGDQPLRTKVESFTVKMAPRFGPAGIYYSAPVTFPVEGRWQMAVRARSDRSQLSANGSVLVSAANGGWRALWPFFGVPVAIVVLFGTNQWLRMSRLHLLA
jgi:hypothetical protein